MTESLNYIKYRTICPVPHESARECERESELSLEKKQAIGRLVTMLQQIAEQQQRDLIFVLKNLSEQKKVQSSVSVPVIEIQEKKEETAEEKLKKAEKRLLELETLLKQMETEKKNAENYIPEIIEKIVEANMEKEKTSEISYANRRVILALKNPRIVKKGVVFKKVTVTWDTIYFGSYPQTRESLLKNKLETDAKRDEKGNYIYGEGENVRKFRKSDEEKYYEYQPIRWRILDIKNGVATLFADKILDAMPYNYTPIEEFFSENFSKKIVRWENSTLRMWLNEDYEGSFYQLAFSEEEKEALVLDEPFRADRVSLLSYFEITDMRFNSYGFYDLLQKGSLNIDALHSYAHTDYTERKIIFGSWWLKDIADKGRDAIYVEASGKIDKKGMDFSAHWVGVRPVIKVDLYCLNALVKKGDPVEAGL